MADNEYDQGAADMSALMAQMAPLAHMLIGPALGNRAMVDSVRDAAAEAMGEAGIGSIRLEHITPDGLLSGWSWLTPAEAIEIFLTTLAGAMEFEIEGYLTLDAARQRT